MSKKVQMMLLGLLVIGLMGCSQSMSTQDTLKAPEINIPMVTKDELRAMLGNPEVVVIDARVHEGWAVSRQKIKGAVREDPDDPNSWVSKYSKDKVLIFYCA